MKNTLMQNKVWNKRDPNCPVSAIYIGRPTKYGNPYTHLKYKTLAKHQVDTVEKAVEKYREDLTHGRLDLSDQDWALLRGNDLICWCAPIGEPLLSQDKPQRCHGQVLLEYLERGCI